MRLTCSIALLATLIAVGCGGNTVDPGTNPIPGTPTGPGTVTNPPRPNQTGMLAFSTTASRGWASIDAYVDNVFVGTLRKYYGSGDTPASCVPDGDARVVTTVAVGPHTYTARSNTGTTWSGNHTISSSGSCREINLTCGGGDCSR
jgi:hypothetical protein